MSTDPRMDRVREGQARLAEAAALGRRTTQIEHDLDVFDRALGAAFESAIAEAISRVIEPGLGTVEVDGTGRLLDIRLDAETVKLSDPNAFADRVLAALRAAEHDAHTRSLTRTDNACAVGRMSDY